MEPRNKLTQPEFFNLCTYLKNNENILKGLTTDAIQKCVHQYTGIKKVGRCHLKRAQETLGVDWIVQVRVPPAAAKPDESIRVVARHLAEIYDRLGESIPGDLAKLAGVKAG